MKISNKDIADAVEDSKEVEVSNDKKQVRRHGNKEVPTLDKKEEKGGQRKRDNKAEEKKGQKDKKNGKDEEEKKEEEEDDYERDEKGNILLVPNDFENPLIYHFETNDKEGAEFKVNWKEVENTIKKDFPRLKLVYSRAD